MHLLMLRIDPSTVVTSEPVGTVKYSLQVAEAKVNARQDGSSSHCWRQAATEMEVNSLFCVRLVPLLTCISYWQTLPKKIKEKDTVMCKTDSILSSNNHDWEIQVNLKHIMKKNATVCLESCTINYRCHYIVFIQEGQKPCFII